VFLEAAIDDGIAAASDPWHSWHSSMTRPIIVHIRQDGSVQADLPSDRILWSVPLGSQEHIKFIVKTLHWRKILLLGHSFMMAINNHASILLDARLCTSCSSGLQLRDTLFCVASLLQYEASDSSCAEKLWLYLLLVPVLVFCSVL
jgi:hypothetical protein